MSHVSLAKWTLDMVMSVGCSASGRRRGSTSQSRGGVNPEEVDAAEPEEEPVPVAGFIMEEAMPEFAVTQAAEIVEQAAIPESIQD